MRFDKSILLSLFLLISLSLTGFSNNLISSPKYACSDGDLITFVDGLFVCQHIEYVYPSGSLIPYSSGSSCTSGFTEATDFDGRVLLGTTVSNGNVGGIGGSSSITPTGTNSAPAFTGSSSNVSAATFTGNIQNMTVGNNISLLGLGSALVGPTSITPAGTINSQTVTPSGTVAAPTFTGNAFDPTPLFKRVIWCRRN
jgi:hypothetical protein